MTDPRLARIVLFCVVLKTPPPNPPPPIIQRLPGFFMGAPLAVVGIWLDTIDR